MKSTKYLLGLVVLLVLVIGAMMLLKDAKEVDSADQKGQDLQNQVVPNEAQKIDVSSIVPGGFEGDSVIAQAQANAWYVKAIGLWKMDQNRYLYPDSVIYFASMSNFFYPNVPAYNILGQVSVQTENIKGGIDYYIEAIRLDSTKGEPFFNLGTAYYIMGNNPMACQMWKKANDLGLPNAMPALSMYCQ